MIKRLGLVAATSAMLISSAAMTTETVAYTYDGRGRLVRVVRSGTINNGVTTQYSHDKAGNRTNVKTTGAP